MVRGYAKKDKRTKNLVGRLTSSDIAVIYHRDLDEVAAVHLAESKVKAVINCERSISGKFPNQGPRILYEAGIPLYDDMGLDFFEQVKENDVIEIADDILLINGKPLCRPQLLTGEEIKHLMEKASENIWDVLHSFVNNTLDYAEREKDLILSTIRLPPVNIDIKSRHVLVVIRGKITRRFKGNQALYRRSKPVMIGVDGGADAILSSDGNRYCCGDMDSVSNNTL